MRHGTGTDLTDFNLLFEVLHRHVLPEVTVQVYQNRIDALHGIENRSQIVVIGNLGRIFLTLQSQLISHKIIAERLPIVTGVGHMMGIVIPRRSAELGCNGARFKHLQLAFQTIDKYHNFFPQTGRRSRLSVCLGQHGHVVPFLGIRAKLGYQFLHLGIVTFLQSFFDGQRNRCIVDVLRCQAEMNEFLISFKTSYFIKLFLDKILHSLHVMVRHALYFLHPSGIRFREIPVDVTQTGKQIMIEISQLRQRQFAQSNKVFNLYTHTIANKRVFRKVGSQSLCFTSITAVYRRNSRQQIQFHKSNTYYLCYKNSSFYRFAHIKIEKSYRKNRD